MEALFPSRQAGNQTAYCLMRAQDIIGSLQAIISNVYCSVIKESVICCLLISCALRLSKSSIRPFCQNSPKRAGNRTLRYELDVQRLTLLREAAEPPSRRRKGTIGMEMEGVGQ